MKIGVDIGVPHTPELRYGWYQGATRHLIGALQAETYFLPMPLYLRNIQIIARYRLRISR